MSMKKLAEIMVESNIHRRPAKKKDPTQPPPPRKSGEVYNPPHSWSPEDREEIIGKPKEVRENEEEQSETEDLTIRSEEFRLAFAETLKKRKRRDVQLTFSISGEELTLIQRHVQTLEVNRSEWLRSVIFRAIGIDIPVRPKRKTHKPKK